VAARSATVLAFLVGAALAACGGGGGAPARRDTAHVASARDSARTSAAESVATARDEWNKAEVVKRLTEAGLVVADSARKARRPGLQIEGELLQVSGSDLELYLYPSAAARQRESAGLDTATHGLPSVKAPRYIFSGNLIAVHVTPSDRLAERVENALMARHMKGP
jgi:hypothetical protein